MKKKHFSVSTFAKSCISILTILTTTGVSLFSPLAAHAQIALNGDCTLVVPPNPLTAQGLATPYQLAGVNVANNGPCHELNRFQSTFVQAAIIDPATGQISIYNPLVVDYGTQPIVPPIVPVLPPNAIVGIWGGTNSNTTTLVDSGGSLAQGNCVNGLPGSVFGQNWHCNAGAFFTAAKQAIANKQLVVPAPGMALDGMPCPTVDSFWIVDQDPHDNVTTQYLGLVNNGQTAQFNTQNSTVLSTAQILTNGSDQRSITSLDQALGCEPFKAPDLTNPGVMTTALPLNELMAYVYPANPEGFVEAGDPFVFDNNGNPNLQKLNLFRSMVGEPPAASLTAPDADTAIYCKNLYNIFPSRFMTDQQYLQPRTSPDPYVANNLFSFLAQRFVATYDQNLACNTLINKQDPITLTLDPNGVTSNATIVAGYTPNAQVLPPGAAGGGAAGGGAAGGGAGSPAPSAANGGQAACNTPGNGQSLNIQALNPNQAAPITCTPIPSQSNNNNNNNNNNVNTQNILAALKQFLQQLFKFLQNLLGGFHFGGGNRSNGNSNNHKF